MMLTKKQKAKITVMQKRYVVGMQKTNNAPKDLVWAWSKRYRIAMERQLQKQHKC